LENKGKQRKIQKIEKKREKSEEKWGF